MRISVVIPVRNGEKYLAKAIESVLAQTHRDLELLVIDNGSTDRSVEILTRYARRDGRIRVLCRPDTGVAAAANRGLEETRGEWVARLDCDDVFMPEKLEKQVAFIRKNPDARIVGTLGYFINDAGRVIGLVSAEGPFTKAEFDDMATRGEPVFFIHSSTLMHRETMLAIGGYREQFAQAEDVDLWLRLAEKGHLLLKVPEPLVMYPIHGKSLTMARNAEQRLHHRWIMACAEARRQGREESCLREFLQGEKGRPWSIRFHARRRDAGERFFQRAALHYACGDYLRLSAFLSVAVMLHPRHVLTRLYDRKMAPMLEGVPGIDIHRLAPMIPGKEACRHAPGK